MRLFRRRKLALVLSICVSTLVFFFGNQIASLPADKHVKAYHMHTINDQLPKNIRNIMVTGNKSTTRQIHHQDASTKLSNNYTITNTPLNTPLNASNQNETQNSFRNTHWMTTHGGGRLGNAMFQYASLAGISSYHGYTATLSSAHYLRRIFKIKAPPADHSAASSRVKRERNPGVFDPSMWDLSHNTNWSLAGYYQSWRYFGNVSDLIRNEFSFRDEVIKEMLKEAPVLANWTRITVGVHVRRGDMASKYEQDRGYNVADVGFLKRAMNYFRKKYDNPVFVVCSDSIHWCKERINAADVLFLNGPRDVDLAALANCDHNIVTSGSFGWWGAWLAGGDVVYFKNFPREKTWLDRQYNKSDYYPPDWVGME